MPQPRSIQFAIAEIKALAKTIRTKMTAREVEAYLSLLQRRQPDLFAVIAPVGADPRCARVHAYCAAFCGFSHHLAEWATKTRLSKYPRDMKQELAGLIARGETVQKKDPFLAWETLKIPPSPLYKRGCRVCPKTPFWAICRNITN